jgi:histidinol dehydrogenase
MKAISFQSLSMDGLKQIGKTIEDLATIEGLDAHKMAVTLRLNYLKEQI